MKSHARRGGAIPQLPVLVEESRICFVLCIGLLCRNTYVQPRDSDFGDPIRAVPWRNCRRSYTKCKRRYEVSVSALLVELSHLARAIIELWSVEEKLENQGAGATMRRWKGSGAIVQYRTYLNCCDGI
jgi:hypothetical protein